MTYVASSIDQPFHYCLEIKKLEIKKIIKLYNGIYRSAKKFLTIPLHGPTCHNRFITRFKIHEYIPDKLQCDNYASCFKYCCVIAHKLTNKIYGDTEIGKT